MKGTCFIATLLLTGSLAFASTSYHVGKAANLNIDGKLEEAAWQSVPATENFDKLAWDGNTKEIKNKSTAKFLVDGENLYVGVRCEESDMANLRGDYNSKTGNNPWSNDCVELFFCPTGLPETFYQFVITAGGGTWQQFYAEGGNIRPEIFMPLYEAKVFHGKDFWSVEVKLPFNVFYMTTCNQWKDTWRANVARQKLVTSSKDATREIYSSWSKLKRKFLEPASFNTLTGIPAKQTDSDFKLSPVTFLPAGRTQSGKISGKISMEITAPEGIADCVLSCSNDSQPEILQKVTLVKGQNVIQFKDEALFQKEGKAFVRLTLKNSGGKVLSDRLSPVQVAYVPLSLKMTFPEYSNCFYPGQKTDRIAGELIVLNGAKSVQIHCAGKTAEVPVIDGKATFALDTTGISGEEWTVSATAGDITASQKIRKLPVRKGNMVWIENGRLLMNGKPTFYLDFYASGYLCNRRYLEEFKANPLPLVPQFRHTEINLEPARLIKGIESKEATKDVKPCQELYEKVRQKLNPDGSFCYYYLSDEPECRGVSTVYLKYIYDYIKEVDPYHPVMIISREPERYMECSDIIIPHAYINPIIVNGKRILDRPVSKMRDILRSCPKRGDKVRMICPGTYSVGYANPHADYPNFDEMYANMWSSVCEGARGFIPYIEYDHVGSHDLRHGVRFMFESARRLEDILCGLDTRQLPAELDNLQISAQVLKSGDGRILLMFANVSPEAENASFSCPELGTASFQEFRGSGKLQVTNGKAQLSFAPYQVLIFANQTLDAELSTLEQVRKQIAEDKNAMATRGNILFQKGRDIEISFSPGKQLINNVAAQVALFDGIDDTCGFMPNTWNQEFWLELAFPKFTPKFTKAKISGYGMESLSFQIWKYGEWITPDAKRNQEKYFTELDFGKVLSTVKIRISFPRDTQRGAPEVYELELFE